MMDSSLFGSTASDPSAQLVRELLAGLNAAVPQPPNRPGKVRSIIGALGDALLTAGVARGGGQAEQPGPFRRAVLGLQQTYQQQLAQEQNRRTQTLEALARLQDQQEQRAISNQFRAAQIGKPKVIMFERDVGGEPHTIRQVLSPTGDTLDEVDLGPKFVAPVVTPATSGDQEELFRIPRTSKGVAAPVEGPGARPLAPLRPELRPRSQIIKTDKGFVNVRTDEQGNIASVESVPDESGTKALQPQESEATKLVRGNLQFVISNVRDMLSTYKENLQPGGPGTKPRSQIYRMGQDVVAGTPLIRETLSDPARAFESLRQDIILALPNLLGAGRRITGFEVDRLDRALGRLSSSQGFTEFTVSRFLRQLREVARIHGASDEELQDIDNFLGRHAQGSQPPKGEKPLSEMSTEELKALRARTAGQP